MFPSVQQDQEAAVLLENSVDPDRLNTLAVRHGVCPVLAENMKRLGFPNDVCSFISGTAKEVRYRSAQQTAVLARIFRMFQENGIRALSLKGPLLAQKLYGTVALRSSGDLDILVDPEHYIKARTLLIKSGYSPIDHITTEKQLRYVMGNPIFHHTSLAKGNICVELHWKSLDLEPLSFDDLYQKRQEEVLCGVSIPVPDSADSLCLLIRHGFHHGFPQLKWIMDIYELLQKADEETLDRSCVRFKQSSSEYALYAFLLLVRRLSVLSVKTENGSRTELRKNDDGSFLLRAPLAEDAFLSAEQLAQAAYLCVTESDPGKIGTTPRKYTFLLRKIRYRLGLAGRTEEFFKLISPGAQDFALVCLPDTLFFLYYPLRLCHWIWRRVIIRRPSQE